MVGHFLESLSNFQTKLNDYVGGSDDEIAIVSEDESSNNKKSKTNNKRQTGKGANKKSNKPKSDTEEIDVISDDDDDPKKKTKSKQSGPTKVAKKKKLDDDEDEQSPEEQDDSGDEDYGSSKKKKASKKSTSKKKASSKKSKKSKSKAKASSKKSTKKTGKKSAKESAPSSKKSGSRASKVIYKEDDEEDDIISSDDQGSDYESGDDGAKRKGKKTAPGKSSKSKLPKPIAVSAMVIDSIKALGDNPKKGSSLRSIKETIEMNWALNIKSYDSKIKKFITDAIDEGKIERVKGSGFSGRFTIPGLKAKKKKKAPKLGKKYDNDEEKEYIPKQSKRDEDREKDKEEAQKQREERWEKEEEKWAQWEKDHANQPKKPKIEKEWEVEAIKSIKEKDDKKLYLVKFKGIARPRWEPEENIVNCDDAINEYIDKQNEAEKQKAKQKQLVEEGQGEAARILDVKFKKVNKEEKREFLIRWKGLTQANDTWVPEEKLNCTDMIKKYMKQYDARTEASAERSLRDAPKKTERLEYASSTKSGRRVAKNGKGFRKTYADMDDDNDWKP